ncbi:PREDICTED: ER membrane protein complex subunit 8 [Chaetura pelagica]|uniref:ER membrane protein complex subunit 8 n=1 Tax=Chaetura pelagica TaxID=8897 RepID=UPI0005235AAF|nr:PREDICTED: ER membrane protein complex subunit 8 [Chaetura pelagica]
MFGFPGVTQFVPYCPCQGWTWLKTSQVLKSRGSTHLVDPLLQWSVTLIDSWCKENSYVIAGYYQANERVKDASPNQVAEKVASRIAEGFNDTALIMVDNTRFTMECTEPAIHVYELHENKWRCKDPHVDFCEDWTEAQRIAASLLDSKSYETLVDFDNHLDDIRNDWTNPEINKAVLHLC